MARSDLLISLVRAGSRGDQALFRKTVEALIAEERAKQHHVLADRLAEPLHQYGAASPAGPSIRDERVQDLLFEVTPNRSLDDLLLPDVVQAACREVIEEHLRVELLRSYNLEPRHRVLLAGPPGNGKTSLAEALAEGLMVPLFVIRYEGVIGSYLGETAVRLRRVFDFVRTRHCVLFLDEFDTLGKERGDVHETGEIKRVVSSLLLQMDGLPSHVLVVTATNHPELLDRAVWRRFQLRLLLPAPDRAKVEEWVCRFERRLGKPLGYPPHALSEKLNGLSFAELDEFGADVRRRLVLSLPEGNLKQIVGERLKQWQARFPVPHQD
jgi:SpoVK/Ycf46/Vps4 family AAA+-type ATPase